MNILIVDDSNLNRIVLKELIQEYQNTHNQSFKIREAVDGIEAINAVKQETFDIIFMDIMMPKMDGIEATKEICSIAKKTMVIAVSAVDDDANKQEILQNGAEDYVQKPINADIFIKRLSHYFGIIEARKKDITVASYGVANLFDSKVYSRQLTFHILNNQTLSEFWDYFTQNDHNSNTTDFVRLFYCIGIWQLKLGYKFTIILEENSDFSFFTMSNAKLLDNQTLMRIIEKNYPIGIFEISGDKLSFCIPKAIAANSATIQTHNFVAPTQAPIVQQPEQVTSTLQPQVEIQPAQKTQKAELKVFNFIDQEDLEELSEITDDLRSLMLVVGSSYMEDSEVTQIASHLQKFGKIIGNYNDLFAISMLVKSLGATIDENIVTFKEKSKDIAQLCQAFNNDLAMWVKKLFKEGAPSLDFMDQSLTSDANMLVGFLKPSTTNAVDVDDIFDF